MELIHSLSDAEASKRPPLDSAAGSFAEPSVKVLLKDVPAVFATAKCLDILEQFIAHPDLYSVAIVNDDRSPRGLIDRNSLIEAFIKPYTRDLYRKKTISLFMQADPVIVDIKTNIDDLARIMIDAGMRNMVNGFIITQNGLYVGMGTGHDLLDEITRRKQAHLYFLAHYDQLTRLPNRLLFGDRLDKACQNARRKGSKVALFFIDLDRFKFVNDALGHAVGDLLLKTVARELLACVRESDTVARLGGDEFTIILENIQQLSDVTVVAERIIGRLASPFSILDNALRVTASIGIALFPDHDSQAAGLIKKADMAMYQAKHGGRDGYQLYVETLGVTTSERLALEAGLQSALENGEFRLFYQPQIALATAEVIGVEALLRWRHPQRGLLLPARFIPIAEETGLIVQIGEWALREACRQHREWLASGLPPIRVAVNVSLVQLYHPGFVDLVRGVIGETGIDPACVELEMTESVIMSHAEATIRTLRELRNLGIQLAIDDFGTGYSSLSYLSQFPLTRLKIDQSFIRNIDTVPANMAIVNAIVMLGTTLGLEIIAEGVETVKELQMLKTSHCGEVQGYHFSRPVLAAEFEHWYKSHHGGEESRPAPA